MHQGRFYTIIISTLPTWRLVRMETHRTPVSSCSLMCVWGGDQLTTTALVLCLSLFVFGTYSLWFLFSLRIRG